MEAVSPLKAQTPRTLLLPLSVGQSKSKGQCRFKRRGKHAFFFFFFFYLHWVLVAVRWLSLVSESRDHSLIVICGLLIVVASFAAELGR